MYMERKSVCLQILMSETKSVFFVVRERRSLFGLMISSYDEKDVLYGVAVPRDVFVLGLWVLNAVGEANGEL
jgi:hypothetical protein